ncbi:MAG: PAS domain S-box protein, partial [Desulfuromusa sp.]
RVKTSFDYRALLTGETDVFNAYRTNEPYLLETQGIETQLINPEDYGIDFYGDVLFTAAATLKTRPKTVEKFRKASLQGWDYALSHQDETIAVIKSRYQIEKTVAQLQFEAAEIKKIIQPEQVEIGHMDLARWAQTTHYLIALGAIPATFHLVDDFIYSPPHPVHWVRLRPWIIGVLATFITLLFLLSTLFKANHSLRKTRKQLRHEMQEREQVEDALRQSSKRFRRLAAVTYEGILIHDQGIAIEVNESLTKMFGYPSAEMIGEELLQQLVPEEYRPIVKENMLKKIAAPYEVIGRKKDGTLFPVEIESRDVTEDDVNYRVTALRDITERKRNEAERERLAQAIAQSSETVIITDTVGTIQYANPAFETISGYCCAEAIGQNPRILQSDQQDPAIYPELWETLTSGEVWRGRFINKKKDGSLYIEDATISPVFNLAGEIVNYIAVKRDITHEVEMENQLRQKYKMEAVGLMAGGIAHNFNNNLAIILGNVELSQLKLPAASDIADYLNNAKIATLRSRDLVQQILTYSREGTQAKVAVKLPLLIDETIKLLHSTIPTTVNLHQVISIDSRDVTINANASQIQEALINLCNNAVYAMDEKGALEILLETVELQATDIPSRFESTPGTFIKLSVQDNGSGISPAAIDKIFDPFFTTKGVGEGTGMGLSTVQGIVNQHGGLLKVNSALGQGSTFELYFPTTPPLQTAEAAPGSEDLPRGTEKILFLDDDEMLSQLGEMMLSEMGYQVTAMTSSLEALKLFKTHPDQFDLVVTDQTMPELCGKDLIQELLKIRPALTTILCTGFSHKIDEKAAKRLGVKAFCMKPLNLPELVQTVRRVLDER